MGQIMRFYGMGKQKTDKISQKKLFYLIDNCPNIDKNAFATWKKCKVYDDLCINCLRKCERMKKLLNNTEIRKARKKKTEIETQ